MFLSPHDIIIIVNTALYSVAILFILVWQNCIYIIFFKLRNSLICTKCSALYSKLNNLCQAFYPLGVIELSLHHSSGLSYPLTPEKSFFLLSFFDINQIKYYNKNSLQLTLYMDSKYKRSLLIYYVRYMQMYFLIKC